MMTPVGSMPGVPNVPDNTSLGFNERDVTDMFAPVVIAGYLGSKLLLLVVDWKTYSHDPLHALQAGGVFYGGLLAGGIVGYLIFRRWNINRWRLADAIAPSIALAQALGRLGCSVAKKAQKATSSTRRNAPFDAAVCDAFLAENLIRPE